MKALVITVPDGFKTAVVTVTYEGVEGKNGSGDKVHQRPGHKLDP